MWENAGYLYFWVWQSIINDPSRTRHVSLDLHKQAEPPVPWGVIYGARLLLVPSTLLQMTGHSSLQQLYLDNEKKAQEGQNTKEDKAKKTRGQQEPPNHKVSELGPPLDGLSFEVTLLYSYLHTMQPCSGLKPHTVPNNYFGFQSIKINFYQEKLRFLYCVSYSEQEWSLL